MRVTHGCLIGRFIVVVFALREDCKTPQPASCGLGGSSAGLKA